MTRQDVQQSGLRQPPIVPGTAVGGESNMIRMVRVHHVRPAYADERREAADRGALRHQGLGQRQWFRPGLAPCDAIAGFDESGEVQGLNLDHFHRDSDSPY